MKPVLDMFLKAEAIFVQKYKPIKHCFFLSSSLYFKSPNAAQYLYRAQAQAHSKLQLTLTSCTRGPPACAWFASPAVYLLATNRRWKCEFGRKSNERQPYFRFIHSQSHIINTKQFVYYFKKTHTHAQMNPWAKAGDDGEYIRS
jgi:hypothetical protein